MKRMKTVLALVSFSLLAAGTCRGQEGYSIQPGKVVVDSPEHWERWHFPAKTVEITDEGVRPVFIRKSTRRQVDGEVVPGINAVLDAAEFGGGVRDAGSNAASAAALMDGRMDTYWEPDVSAPLEDWWAQIDLGRSVSATRILLKFVGEDLGDPFLQFSVTTSQGETIVGPLLFRTRFSTSTPVKNQRLFEIDLTKQLPTKWTNSTGDFTGDVIRYVGVGVTGSDHGKGRQVSRADYETLPPEQQGDVEYFRRDASGRLTLLLSRKHWDSLAGTDRQGPVIHYRRELPRLAAIEVWTIGDNIGTGVLERGGTVVSGENNGAEPSVVDGDYFGEVLYWPAVGGFNPNSVSIREPGDIERQLFIDLGGAFFLDNIRVLQMSARGSSATPFREYRIQLSDGSTHAAGSLVWKTVGEIAGIVGRGATSQRYNNFEFPLTIARYFSFSYRVFPNDGSAGFIANSFALSEVQFFGEGYMSESRITSEFGGDAPFIELGREARNLTSIDWDADLPPGSDLVLQTRTGNTVEMQTHYYKKNGEEYPGSEEEAAEAHASDKKFFGESSVGPVVTETVPGGDWSGWSQPYLSSGDRITSPSPRRFVAVRATLLTDDPMAAATLRSLALNFTTPVAGSVVAEVFPSRLEEIGRKQKFTYLIRSTFEAGSRGFDEVLIEAPYGVEMTFLQAEVRVPGQEAAAYTAASGGFEVVMDSSDSLWVRLPAPVKTTGNPASVELQYEATVFGYNTFFIGSTGHSEFENSWQRIDDGDANGIPDSETTVVLALQRGGVLGDVDIGAFATPDGDGVNDELKVSYSLMRLGAPTPASVKVYDLSGRLVRVLLDGPMPVGRHTVSWRGADRSGATVPPGIYLLRIEIEADSRTSRDRSVDRLVHVAY